MYDGALICALSKENIHVVLDNKGACSIIVGLLDLAGRKFYPFTLWSLVHLSDKDVSIFADDFTDK